MASDDAARRVVLYGGTTRTQLRTDVWEWSGSSWRQLAATSSAGGRRGHGFVFDPARQVFVAFGGVTSAGIVGDTWELADATWTQRTVAAPAARAHFALAYDGSAARSVLFGGWGGGLSYFADTWTWDGSAWTSVTPAGLSPHARAFMSAAYDSNRDRLVLFGGLFNDSSSSTYYGDTWEWDGSNWADVTPPSGSPNPRAYHAMAYDSSLHRTILFGGFSFAEGNFNDTWAWDGSSWNRLATTAAPSLRISPGLAFDSVQQRVLLFGGQLNSTYYGDTWSLSAPATCLADFNCDGGVDGQDVESYFLVWESGSAAADVNADGGVDGADVEFFFTRWEAGC